MHFKFRYLQKIVGAFVLLAGMMLFVLLAVVARGQRWFQRYAHYTVVFEKASGLAGGAMVTMQDMQVGKVKSLALDESDRVRVDLAVYAEYANRIRQGTTAALSAPLIGATSVALKLGAADQPVLPHGSMLPADAAAGGGLSDLVSSGTKLLDSLQNPKGDLMEALAHVNRITAKVDESLTARQSTLRLLLEQRTLYDQLLSSTKHLDSLMAHLDRAGPDIEDVVLQARQALFEANKVIMALQQSIFLKSGIDHTLKQSGALTNYGR